MQKQASFPKQDSFGNKIMHFTETIKQDIKKITKQAAGTIETLNANTVVSTSDE